MSEKRYMSSKDDRLGNRQQSVVIPIRPAEFLENFLKDLTSPRIFADEREAQRHDIAMKFTIISNLISKIMTLWSGKGNLIISTVSEEAMKEDLKRKVYALIETVKKTCLNTISDLTEKLNILEQGVVEIEKKEELINDIRRLLIEISMTDLAVVIIIDNMLGVVQVNLPADLMSNLIKTHMGFVTT